MGNILHAGGIESYCMRGDRVDDAITLPSDMADSLRKRVRSGRFSAAWQ